MKKITLTLIGLLFTLSSFAQDPEIIGTWYLKAFMVDTAPNIYITSSDAPQNPTLIINLDYSFEGIGACNTFTGNFVYSAGEDAYYHENFVVTNLECETNDYNSFEDLYFSYFDDSIDEYLTMYISISGELIAQVSSTPGFGMVFQDTPFLGINDLDLVELSISPNPTTNTLFITSENLEIKQLSVFNISGQKVMEIKEATSEIDVSPLQSGIYFLEINSEEGIAIKKFVKK